MFYPVLESIAVPARLILVPVWLPQGIKISGWRRDWTVGKDTFPWTVGKDTFLQGKPPYQATRKTNKGTQPALPGF